MMRRLPVLLALILLPTENACTRKAEDRPQKAFVLLGRDEEQPGKSARRDLSTVSPSAVLVPVYSAPPSPYEIRIEPEDTLDLFAKWTGKPVAEIVRLNPDLKHHGLVPGEWLHLMLTPDEFTRFKGLREGYLAKARATRTQRGLPTVVHQVGQNETIRDLLLRYPTKIELIEQHNPGIQNLTSLRPGQKLVIPIVAEDQRDVPLAPKPPTPPPAPEPPPRPKVLTATAAGGASDSPKAQGVKPAQRATSKAKVTTYVVQPGDTAWGIAARHKVTRAAFVKANPGIDMNRLKPGQTVVLPAPGR